MPQPFLIDDETPPPQGATLHGCAFAEADAVLGTDGLAALESEGRVLDWHADGCHLLVRRDGDRIALGADFAGYRHLFHWSDGARWAVCDSFIDLVAHLRARGIALEEDIAQTGAFLSRKQLFQQLTSAATPVKGISCLRVDERIEIDADGLRIVTAPPAPERPYAEALHAFLELWLARMEGLRRAEGLTLFIHLSGGLDSRAVAAFHLWLERNRDLPENATIRSLTDDSHAEDLRIAERLAEATGLRLNHIDPRPRRNLTVDEALAAWRHHSAGVYSPVRVPSAFSHPADINFSGHATNGYKYRFTDEEADRRVRVMERSYAWFGHGDRPRWRAALRAELDRLAGRGGSLGQAWAVYQRTQRARFHAGQAATYKTQVALFHSASAAAAAEARPQDAPDYQFYHDILAALAPDLMELALDDPRKAPGPEHRAALTAVAPLAPEPGRVYGAVPSQGEGAADAPSRLELARALLAEIDAAGWPKGRVSLIFRWHLFRLRRDLARGRARHAVRLRHLHAAWLLGRLRALGVRMEGEA
ncbi:hypothetical protein [Roseivivax marinus]|uniref:hypothetical protein n=1 Tax=Roseivivax marinus TaxID=1379903 RepID=UPI00273D0F4F|nr:hypothetical protein [Roseivivax marinus]